MSKVFKILGSLFVAQISLLAQFANASDLTPFKAGFAQISINSLGRNIFPAVHKQPVQDAAEYDDHRLCLRRHQSEDTFFFQPNSPSFLNMVRSPSSLANCRAVNEVLESNKTVQDIRQRLALDLKDFQSSEQNLNALRVRSRAAADEVKSLLKARSDLADHVDFEQGALELNSANLIECRLNRKAPDVCKFFENLGRDLKVALAQAQLDLTVATNDLEVFQEKHSKVVNEQKDLASVLEVLLSNIVKNQNRLKQIGEMTTLSIEHFNNEDGGSLSFNISLQADAEIESLEKANPGFHFLPFAPEDVSFRMVSPLRFSPSQSMVKLKNEKFEVTKQIDDDSVVEYPMAGSTGLNVSLRLTRVIACGQTSGLRAGFRYKYKMNYRANGVVEYPDYKVYEFLEKSTDSNGLISTGSIAKLRTTLMADPSFIMTMNSVPLQDHDSAFDAMWDNYSESILTDMTTSVSQEAGGPGIGPNASTSLKLKPFNQVFPPIAPRSRIEIDPLLFAKRYVNFFIERRETKVEMEIPVASTASGSSPVH